MKTIIHNILIQKFISLVLIISILAPSAVFLFRSGRAQAVGEVPTNSITANTLLKLISKEDATTSLKTVEGWLQKLKELALKIVAKVLLAKITEAVVTWINNDFHGSPHFLENPGRFFGDIAKSQIKGIVEMIGYDTFKFPFGQQTALNVLSSYKSQLAINGQYSLSRVIDDPEALIQFRNNFDYGGWNGFLINTQYPQNNYLGFEGMVKENLASRLEGTLQAPAQKIQNALQQGMGFLSPQTCPTNSSYNNGSNEFVKPSFKPSIDYVAPEYSGKTQTEIDAYNANYKTLVSLERKRWAEENTCPGGLVNTTPGSVAANQIMTALNIPTGSKMLDAAIGNSIAAILDALINKVIEKGLNAMTGAISGGGSSENDNWSFEGQTLGGGTTTVSGGITTESGLYVPTGISIRAGETTSISLSGGKGPYTATINDPAIAVIRTSSSGTSGYTLIVTGQSTISTPLGGTITVRDSGTSCHKLSGTTLPDGTKGTITASDACVATFPITVSPAGALAIGVPGIFKDNIYTVPAVINETVTATIFGGDGNYSLQSGAGPNQEVAAVAVAGDSLIISAGSPGRIIVVIKDTFLPTPHTIPVTIIVSSTAVTDMVIPQDLKIVKNLTKEYGPIVNGTGPYVVTVTNANIIPNPITIDPFTKMMRVTAGSTLGVTQISISDSTPETKSGTTNIEVTDPMGTCKTAYLPYCSTNIIKNMTEQQCTDISASCGKSWCLDGIEANCKPIK